ncbi:MAG: choice-of-anchor D domain-containing protein, partial [Candidatus Sulfotelmatobacter sp.]
LWKKSAFCINLRQLPPPAVEAALPPPNFNSGDIALRMTFRKFALQSFTRIFMVASLLCLLTPLRSLGQSCISVSPADQQIYFPAVALGTSSRYQRIGLTNNCGVNIEVNSISLSSPEFVLQYGWAPVTKVPGSVLYYAIRFRPDGANTFNGTFTVNVQGFSPITVNLTGTGYVTQAASSLSANAFSFGNLPVGSTSAAQALTIANTGTASFTVEAVYADPPFTVSGFSGQPTTLVPGGTIPVQVTFTPSNQSTFNGTLVVTSDILPPKGATLSGAGTPPTALAVTTYPTLQSATQGFAYNVQLNGAGGKQPLTWSLANGSSLPRGLVLSSQGRISGTLGSSVAPGNYSFTVSVADSSPRLQTATVVLTLPVGAPTGSACGNISWNVAESPTPLTDLIDLGAGTYYGVQGGLYLNGSNVMPPSHDSDGVGFAQAIQPLDANGNPDPNGKYALLLIGMSCALDTSLQFIQDATAEPTLNPNLVFVPGAMLGANASNWADPTFGGWVDVMDFFLPQQGMTANQVVAAWVLTTDGHIQGTFPDDMTNLQSEYESIAQNLHSFFPNLKMAFYSSRFYGAYGNGQPNDASPEPYAYESGFAVRGVITDQLNGVPSMNYNPANGPVMAPWVAWADYDWANGLRARNDGFAWSCQDFDLGGEHTSTQGSEKDANLMLNFFRSDDATVPWFLAPATNNATRSPRR